MPQDWETRNQQEWLREDWEEETFLFNPLSGHTHILNLAASELLNILATTPTDIDRLTSSLFDKDSGLDPGQFKALLARQLKQLYEMGLIRPAL